MQVGHHASALIYISSPVYITNDHFPLCVSGAVSMAIFEREKTGKNLLPFLEFLSSIGNLNKYFFLSANSGF